MATNYIINLLLLLCCAKILAIKINQKKIVAASLFASTCSLSIFLPYLGSAGEILLKICTCAIITRIALPYINIKIYLQHIFVFFCVSFIFAGIILGLWFVFSPNWLTYYNGFVYFNISSITLIISSTAAYIILHLINRIFNKNKIVQNICTVEIHINKKFCTLNALIDTGNNLCEPFSGTPVIVCCLMDLIDILPENIINIIKEDNIKDVKINNFRLIPYGSVGKSGVLPAFMPDKIIIKEKTKTRYIFDVYIALEKNKIGTPEYSCILNPKLSVAYTTSSVKNTV